MLAQVLSGAVDGIESVPVRVEIDLAPGIPSMSVVGLAQGAVREGRDRVRAALAHSGYPFPPHRVTVNLAPADLKKEGSGLDLPLALGLLVALGHLPSERLRGQAFVGELGLDGSLRPVRGTLAIARRCACDGIESLIVPRANAREAAAADPALKVIGAPSLRTVVDHLAGSAPLAPAAPGPEGRAGASRVAGDLSEVRGHAGVKRALEVAAAGGHNVLLIGPPGSGKTMLARRLPGLLPPLARDEALDATTIHSVAGLLPEGAGLLAERPFRAPHHTISRAGLAGGGTPVRPGEMSLAHCGILFLDELPEFPRSALETLRQPLESGFIALVRARERLRFPARFSLVGAMNPCPCGHLGDPARPCTCDPSTVARYRGRISGPLLDRIDMHLEIQPVGYPELEGARAGAESSADVRARVVTARAVQVERMRGSGLGSNSEMEAAQVQRHARPTRPARALLEAAADRMGLSARAIHRVLKVARTVADLDGESTIGRSHVAEAIQYRVLDRGLASRAG